ncbi:hypothetical protein LWI29_035708 [Acer saccharum]|uniref:Uncharacterized protein n=1 Tax=Acer saccharum TaxID=4024 RepID=A0AA39W3P1_ACESA|nr:hypothetical protein LWI29_035708 [Acer saccharum]
MLVNKNVDSSEEANAAISLVGNVGLSPEDFAKLRLLCLFLSCVIQIVALSPNLQMYLNEAVLSWYQKLHASKVLDLDFSRAKVFLHNHFLCLASSYAVVCTANPGILILKFSKVSSSHGMRTRNSLKSGSVEEEAAKTVELGIALGFDFSEVEDEVLEEITRREKEDIARFEAISG